MPRCALFCLLLLAPVADASVIFHTTQASFDAAIATDVFTDFEGIVADDGLTFASSLTVDGVTYTDVGGATTICGKDRCGGNPHDSAFLATGTGDPLEIDVSGLGTVLGAGGIFADTDSGPTNATLRLYGPNQSLLDTQNVQVADLGAGLPHSFFGWTVSGGDVITQIDFDMLGTFEALDNMQFAVPEPSAGLLVGVGLLGLAGSRRRKARARA